MHERRTFATGIEVSLDGARILLRQSCVSAEPSVEKMPAVLAILAARIREVIVVEVLCEDSVSALIAEFRAKTGRARSLILCSSSGGEHTAESIGGFLRDDINHPIHGIR